MENELDLVVLTKLLKGDVRAAVNRLTTDERADLKAAITALHIMLCAPRDPIGPILSEVNGVHVVYEQGKWHVGGDIFTDTSEMIRYTARLRGQG